MTNKQGTPMTRDPKPPGASEDIPTQWSTSISCRWVSHNSCWTGSQGIALILIKEKPPFYQRSPFAWDLPEMIRKKEKTRCGSRTKHNGRLEGVAKSPACCTRQPLRRSRETIIQHEGNMMFSWLEWLGRLT